MKIENRLPKKPRHFVEDLNVIHNQSKYVNISSNIINNLRKNIYLT